MSMVEVVNELKKIRGKYLREEGIYVFPKSDVIELPQSFLGITPIETDVYDFSLAKTKLFFLINKHDVDANVQFLASYDPQGEFIPVRQTVSIPADSSKIALSTDGLIYVKLKLWTDVNPTEGYFKGYIVRWAQ